jgi:hypothetical protein
LAKVGGLVVTNMGGLVVANMGDLDLNCRRWDAFIGYFPRRTVAIFSACPFRLANLLHSIEVK